MTINIQVKKISIKLGIAFFSSIITGIICGFLLRSIMRIIGIVFPHMASNLTLEGIFSLLVAGTSFCLASSILFCLIESKLTKNWFKKGFIYGILILIFYGTTIIIRPGLSVQEELLVILLFTILFISGGLLMSFWFWKISDWAKSPLREKLLSIVCYLLIIPAVYLLGQNTIEIVIRILQYIRQIF
jgi:hypothetical protein